MTIACLFSGVNFVALLVYVDDVLVTSPNIDLINQVKSSLHHGAFTIKDLGPARYFPGLEIARSDSDMYVNQRKYVIDLISDCGLTWAKSTSTPMVKSHKPLTFDGVKLENPMRYRRLIGRLLY